MQSAQQIITEEIKKLILSTKESLGGIKRFAIGEVWGILQLLTATVIRIIEKIGTDLSSPEKKALAMNLITQFYDRIFTSIDIPMIPSPIEAMLHSYIKKVIMILVDSAIDSMVTTFRDIGVFTSKHETFSSNITGITSDNSISNDFIKNLKSIVRTK